MFVFNFTKIGRKEKFLGGNPICAKLSGIENKKMAIIAAVSGSIIMGVISVFSNNFLVYPIYYRIGMSKEVILQAYQVINPAMDSILECLICFNLPFTIVKGLIASGITILIYKPLSPILKGRF